MRGQVLGMRKSRNALQLPAHKITMEESLEKQTERSGLKAEIRQRMLGYILGAFGLVAGLAWNDAIRAFIEHIFPLAQDTLSAKFLYAGIISLIVVIASVYILELANRGSGGDKKL